MRSVASWVLSQLAHEENKTSKCLGEEGIAFGSVQYAAKQQTEI